MTQEQNEKLEDIRELMLDYGIRSGAKGFEQLAHCVLFRNEDRFMPFKQVFQKAAEATGTTCGMIPHYVKAAIAASPAFPKRIDEAIGIKFRLYQIYPSLAIAYLERFLTLPFPRPNRKGGASDAGV